MSGQLGLFAPVSDVPAIEGLRLLTEYIDEATEAALAFRIDDAPAWSHEYERRRQHYGHGYEEQAPTGRQNLGWPRWLARLAHRMANDGIFAAPPNSCLVNEYRPGQGIALHVDRSYAGEVVTSLSLLSPCSMTLRRLATPPIEHELWLPRRSLLVMRGAARHRWQHGIARRKSDPTPHGRIERTRRLSLTLRLT
ncbi:MAG: alpha-ketoglutarate-dependent dioxygenase AlkB [Myxococcota bacterium]